MLLALIIINYTSSLLVFNNRVNSYFSLLPLLFLLNYILRFRLFSIL